MRPLSSAIAGSGTPGGAVEVGAACTTASSLARRLLYLDALRPELVAQARRLGIEPRANLEVELDIIGLCVYGDLVHHRLRRVGPGLHRREARKDLREDDGVLVDCAVDARDKDFITGEASVKLCNF